jgi:ketosteroid isomerase-like protein
MTYRLWIGPEDFGTAAERQAKAWLEVARMHDSDARIEPVADDAPVFLPTQLPPKDADNRRKEFEIEGP